MRLTFASVIGFAAAASAKSAKPIELDSNGLPGTPVSPNPFPMAESDTSPALNKRWLFWNPIDTTSDIYNCGRIGNICSSLWSNGWGAQCSNSKCGPAYCSNLFDFDWGLGSCRDVSSDKSNCGKCGQTCATSNVPYSTAVSCVSGTCAATSCQNGYLVSAGSCTKKLDLLSDTQNCGTAGNRCPSGWAFSTGSQCLQGVCQPVSVNAGYAFSVSLNKCVDLSSDLGNCGALNKACSYPNGQASCTNGVCSLKSCNSNFNKVDTQCVALNLQSDAKNCGSQGNDCTTKYSNGVGMCSSGTCTFSTCNPGFKRVSQTTCTFFIFCSTSESCQPMDMSSDMSNCGKPGNVCASNMNNGRSSRCENGVCLADCNDGYDWDPSYSICRDVRTDTSNCGRCGQVCSIANGSSQCVSGSCQVLTCNNGYQPNSSKTGCVAINTQIDPNNCGSQGVKCPASYANGGAGVCVSGKCTTTCNSGYLWDGVSSCVSSSSNDNCGAIGNKCNFANGSGSCKSGVCTLDSCASGFTKSSDGKNCVSINMNTDAKNCGKIGNACPAFYSNGGAGICVNGACTTTCTTGYQFDPSTAPGQCKATTNDANNCGSLGNKCLYANGVGACVNGQCSLASCSSPYTKVGNTCVDTSADINNCGSSGNRCDFGLGSGSCVNGKCVATKCNTGFKLLDGVCKAIQYNTDPDNCGGDGIQCPKTLKYGSAGSSCVLGKCIGLCDDGWDWDPLGFCRDITNDVNNCGKCGQTCNLTGAIATQCVNRQCKATGCKPGYNLKNGVCVAADTNTDVNNCGSPPLVCPANYPNGGAAFCQAGKCMTTCNPGYTWDSVGKGCVSTNSNDNCGGLGVKCTVQNGLGACVNGQCTVGSCAAGYIPSTSGAACVLPNTANDVKNCGSFGNACKSSYPGGTGAVTCQAGACVQGCPSGSIWNPATLACVSTNDVNNCGALGVSCAVPNGKGSCKNGQCSFDGCNDNYARVGTTNVCAPVNTDSDTSNCGKVGNVCRFDNGTGSCQKGVCVPGPCNPGFELRNNVCKAIDYDSNPNNCGYPNPIVCPSAIPNGEPGRCVLGKCVSTCKEGFDWDPIGLICRDVTSDNNNCGKCGQVCKLPGATATKCQNGKCKATACQIGYTLDTVNGVCTGVDTTSDPKNCGSLGFTCQFLPSGATGTCKDSKCVITNCPSGYTLLNGVCSQSTGPSQAPRANKRSKITKPKTLCPGTETACPIIGSASFAASSMAEQFTSADFASGLMDAAGGYECVDTTQALESCGGCVALGEGQNCQAISHVAGVGCEAGVCVVFSCQPGYRPNIAGTKCVRVHAHHDTSASNGTGSHRRHMHSRQQTSGGHHA